MSPNDFTSEEREILIVALNNMTEVMIEVDKYREYDGERLAAALIDIDKLKDKIANNHE